MIFTTNKPLNEWGKVLHDEDMAAAILDRVLERGRFIHLDGPSGRTRHLNLEEVLPGGRDRARISGIDLPEFPEPTLVNNLTPIDSNWNLAEAATSSFAVSWELNVWVRLPHASANHLILTYLAANFSTALIERTDWRLTPSIASRWL